MTPKTQSVCKHCQREKGAYIHMMSHAENHHKFEPVAEPASTGEPQSCPCPCHKGESVICNCGGGFECEYINSIPAARPSEPSANFMQKIGGTCLKHGEYNGQQCPKWPDCISAAAPQPVSGMYISETKPHKVDDARITEIFNREPVSGDAPKVEEIARKLHLYHCQERRSGSICPCHVIAEGMSEGCHCKEETADIASILRRYFPPASQKPTRDAVKWLEDMGYGVNGKFALDSKRNWQGYEIKEILELFALGFPESGRIEPLATPASTARTDGLAPECHPMCGSPYLGNSHHPDCERGAWEAEHWCSHCSKPITEEIYRCMECTHPFHRVCLFRHCGKDKLTSEPYLDALKLAPGSVPQAPKDECLYGPVGKHIFNPHDDEPRRCINCGVPQAEPPKEEKP